MNFPQNDRYLCEEPLQVTCIALLHIAHARAERDAARAATSKVRRGSISSAISSSTTGATAFDIQATVHVTSVLQRLLLIYNIIVPATVLRFCQVTLDAQFVL